MMKEWTGKIMACLWLAMISYGVFPLGTSAAGIAAFCLAIVILLRAGLHMERWPMWKSALLICLGGALGMLTRYIAEYGEAWWKVNFTAENAARHLLSVTLCGICVCWLFEKSLQKNDT